MYTELPKFSLLQSNISPEVLLVNFVCETITAVNWPLIESFRFYDENDYEYEIVSILWENSLPDEGIPR